MASENSVNYYYWLVSGMALCSLYYMEGLRKLKMFSPMVFAHAAWGWGGGVRGVPVEPAVVKLRSTELETQSHGQAGN